MTQQTNLPLPPTTIFIHNIKNSGFDGRAWLSNNGLSNSRHGLTLFTLDETKTIDTVFDVEGTGYFKWLIFSVENNSPQARRWGFDLEIDGNMAYSHLELNAQAGGQGEFAVPIGWIFFNVAGTDIGATHPGDARFQKSAKLKLFAETLQQFSILVGYELVRT